MKIPSIKKLEEQIKQLENYFTKVRKLEPSHSRLDKLKEISDKLKKQTYNIAIVANMSAGKSTFINALFGEEILPSSTGATTDCATYVYSKRDGSMQKQATITFKDNKGEITLRGDLSELQEYAKKDGDGTEKKYRNVEKIELHHPFKYIPKEEQKDDLEIYFVDTPGPNNQGQGAEKHSTQTRNAIHDAHAVLFLFDFTQIPATYGKDGNPNDLWSIIKEKKDSNSSFKIFFIVNKFDEFLRDAKLWDAVEKKKEDIRKELKETAEVKGIKDAEVFFTAARPALAWRMDETLSDYTRFKEDFEKVCPKNDKSQALNDFMGIDIIEDRINNYLSDEAYPRFLEFCLQEIFKPIKEELSELEQRIHTLDKEKGDARKNTDKANEALDNLENEERELRNKLKNARNTAHRELEEILQEQQQTIEKQAEEIAENAILYLAAYASGKAEKTIPEFIRIDREQALNKIKKETTIQAINQDRATKAKEVTNKYVSDCISKILSDYNPKIQNTYLRLEKEHRDNIEDFKKEVEGKINEALELRNTFNTPKQIESSYHLNLDLVGDSINFQPQIAWGNFFINILSSPIIFPIMCIFDKSQKIKEIRAKTNYKKTIENYQKHIKKEMENFKVNQLKEYEESLKKSDQQVWTKIEQYKKEKKDYIEKLQKDIKNKEETRKEAMREKAELTKLQAYEYYKNQGVES